ncbi:MAG: NAD(P)-dependent oxidoreductase, partial [Gallicola sp.]|nr:NAD(P)-dependent oxidoreductase [Gallicola sp.]
KDVNILCGSYGLHKIDLNTLEDLQLILLQSIGIDYMPLDEIHEKGIVLCNNKGAYSKPMGEWIVFNMLEIVKENRHFIDAQRDSEWEVISNVRTLFGKTALFLGTGTIAQEAAKRLQGFEMKVIGFNTSGSDVQYFNEICTSGNLREKMGEADFVIVTLPSTGATDGFIDEEKLSWMKESASIINVARGNIIDEPSLIKALSDKKIHAAAIDVFVKEPLPKDSPLWEMENVYLTPHNSFESEYTEDKQFETIFENLKRYKLGQELINVVDLNRRY